MYIHLYHLQIPPTLIMAKQYTGSNVNPSDSSLRGT